MSFQLPGLPIGLTPTLPQLPNLVSGLPISALPVTADISQTFASAQKYGGYQKEDGTNSHVHGKSGEGNSTKPDPAKQMLAVVPQVVHLSIQMFPVLL